MRLGGGALYLASEWNAMSRAPETSSYISRAIVVFLTFHTQRGL